MAGMSSILMPRAGAVCAAAALAGLLWCLGLPTVVQAAPTEKAARERTPPARSYARHEAAQQFAAEVAQRNGWPLKWAEQAIGKAQHIPVITRLIMPPPSGTPKNWQAYRERFVEPKRLQAGVAFWREHQRSLERAEKETGVPAWLITGVIGVETYYGRHMGGFRVLDALATLSFDFPPGRSDRSAFFRSELEALLTWARREGRKPESVKGSYAGAIGWPQFMPGSILRHAVDFDRDGHINLERSVPDAIGSVANFLKAHGWQAGQPTHFSVVPPTDGEARSVLLAPDILPSFSAREMADKGAQLADSALLHEGPLALVELQNGTQAPSYVAGTQNFYVITRYNWSSYYALAVIELGRAVDELRQQPAAGVKGTKPATKQTTDSTTKSTTTAEAQPQADRPAASPAPVDARASAASPAPASSAASAPTTSATPRTTD